jgi:hypothetical protein
MRAFGTIAMPQVQRSGTAWERRLDHYAYTASLNRWGWAWEFLRRSEHYIRDYRTHRAGRPQPIVHSSGATIMRLRRRVLAAEKWGLQFFADPRNSVNEIQVFWRDDLITNTVNCAARNSNDNYIDPLSLNAFSGRRAVLVTSSHELVTIQHKKSSASMIVRGSTFVIGQSALTFEIEGLERSSRNAETLRILRLLRSQQASSDVDQGCEHCKYRDYLIALDGRLAGRTYREIAEVLYGADRIKPYWNLDTFGHKSMVRRAVEQGLALMNGGYRDLL